MTPLRATSLLLLMGATTVSGCREQRAPTASPPAPQQPAPTASSPLARYLPDAIPPYSAGPLKVDPAFIRRDYTRGKVRIDVTIAKYHTTDEQYQQWVQMSADYPPATLDVPQGMGSGFYDCSGQGESATCNLHIQLRPSFHIEIMGDGTATRADLEQLLRGLPLRRLLSAE